MKKYITYFLLLALCVFPIFTQAMNTYDNAVNSANKYIEQYKSYDYDRYINTENTRQIYSGGKLVNSSFYRGGFLSKEEYEISLVRGHSYLSTGIEYWLSNTNGNKASVLSNVLSERIKTEPSGIRVSVLPKPGAYVKGTGNFNNPWEFLKSYYIYVGSNDTTMGTVSPNEKQYVLEDRKGIVTYSPKLGYKYVNNTCAELVGSITQNVSASKLEIGGLRQDTSCKIIFGPKTFILSLEEEGITTAPVPKTIYLKYNTGFYSDAAATTTINNIVIPEKIGYIFKGYKLGETLLINETGSIDTSKKKAVINNDDNQQLNSLWNAIKYNVVFNKNASDATGSMESQQFTYDQTTNNNLRINNFARTGYTFLGWSKNANATTAEYQDGAAVLNLAAINNDNVTLYAVWKANNYSIRFESCDGAIASNKTISKKYDEYFDVTAVYTKTGYSIIGYSKTSCGGNKDYPINSQTRNLANIEGSSVTLYALWKSNDYKIVYEPNGGTGAIDATQCTYDSNCSVTTAKFNRAGYEFVGWNTSSSATTANYTPGQVVKNLKSDSTNFTLYAIWKQCSAGKYSSTNVCVNCPAGKWSGAGAANCSLSCDAGYKCVDGSKTACTAGTYSTGGASSCTACGAGTYNTGTGNTSCTACPAGKYASGTGNTSCTACPAGKYSGSGESSCTSCNAGTYNTTTGNSSCSTCPSNYYCTGGSNKTSCPEGTTSYSGSKTSSDCMSCPSGTYYNGSSCVTCTAGYKCTGGNRTACPAGTYSSSGSSSCTACAAGKYASGTGNTSCTPCAAGKYASGTGNTSCTSCAAGKYASGTGNTTCTPCSGGTYNTGTGNTSCRSCGENTYASGTGNTSCTPCPTGQISTGGATQCTSCSNGQYLSNGSCLTCPAGYYCKNGTKTACSAGTYSGSGASSCTTCSGGTYNTGTGNTSCSTCPSNYYCTGGSNKTACPNGGTSSAGSSSSSQCVSICSKSDSTLFGTSKDSISGNSTSPTVNVPDSWGNWCHTGGTTCLAPKAYTRVCASSECGSFRGMTATAINNAAGCDFAPYWCTECCSNGTNNGDGTCKRTCQAGTYDNGSTCVACPMGRYTSSSGRTSCSYCAGGMWTSSTGSTTCDIECPAGYKCSVGSKTACSAGTYSTVGSSSCSTCPAGYRCPGSTNKILCAAGTYASGTGNTSCSTCAAGTYSNSGSSSCTTCPAGKYSGSGASSCTTCPAGYYCTGGANKTSCGTGYTSAAGSTSKSACYDNTKPTVSCTKTNTGGTGGVTVTCTCSDSGSGCTSATVIKTLTSSQYVYMSDRAGNQGSAYVTVTKKTEYRYKTCNSFKSCQTSGCGYASCQTSGCGYASCATSSCGCSTYKTCANSACGCSTYKSCATSGCGCKTYKTCASSACGYKSCATSACGYKTCTRYYSCSSRTCTKKTLGICTSYSYSGCAYSYGGYSYSYNRSTSSVSNSNCGYKTCAASACGYASCATSSCGCSVYKSCANSACGCSVYKSCATSGCGCSTYKTCASSACGYKSCANSACGYKSCANSACGCTLLGWSSWSSWSTTSCTESNSRQCDSRVTYN